MAGGKLSARQKMINLMYLVFIAMIAMTMSKEVLSAFGLMNKKFVNANELATNSNGGILRQLNTQAEEKPDEFEDANEKAKQINIISDEFYKYIESIKAKDIVKNGKYELDDNGELPYEEMDKGDKLDELWFSGDRLTTRGKEIVDRIEKYKNDLKEVIPEEGKWLPVISNIDKTFSTSKVENNDGKKLEWLNYHFQGFPTIASYTKLTAIQNDIKATETNIYNGFLGNLVSDATSLKNYKAIVLADKSAFFAGEKFQGRVVLGKYANVTPTKLVVEGQEIDLSKESAIDSLGAANLDFRVGNVGEHDIEGKFTFLEDGKPLDIPIIGNYVVVPRPNSATISADKMNVVYRGVSNPMTISFAGVPDNKVRASAPGLSGSGGKYVMKPGTGREVTIKVSATLDDGSPASDSKKFRIKDLPKPIGKFNGQVGNAKLPKSNVEIGKLAADFGDDFDFKLPLNITSFTMKVPGKPSVNCSGNRLNSAAKTALRSARRGDLVQFINIKAKAIGNPIKIKTVTPVVIELAN